MRTPTTPVPELTVRGTVRKNRIYYPEEDVQRAIEMVRDGVFMARAARLCNVPAKAVIRRVHAMKERGEIDLYWGKRAPGYQAKMKAENQEMEDESTGGGKGGGKKKKRHPRYREYSMENMAAAVEAVKAGKYTTHAASCIFNVTSQRLKDILEGEGHVPTPKEVAETSRRTSFKLEVNEERIIIEYALALHRIGYPVTYLNLIPVAQEFLKQRGDRLKDERGWGKSFVKRHAELKDNKYFYPRELANMSNRECATKLYDRLTVLYNTYNFHMKPSRIYACEAVPFQVQRWSADEPAPTIVKVEILVATNAVGYHIFPPCVVHAHDDVNGIPDFLGLMEAGFVQNNKEKVTAPIMAEWFRSVFLHYLPCRSADDPIVLIINGHPDWMSPEMINLAQEEHIHLVPICSRIRFWTNPILSLLLNVRDSFACRMKAHKAARVRQVNQGPVKEECFPVLLRQSFSEYFNLSCIQAEFKRTGMFPLKPDEVDLNQVIPADVKQEFFPYRRDFREPKRRSKKKRKDIADDAGTEEATSNHDADSQASSATGGLSSSHTELPKQSKAGSSQPAAVPVKITKANDKEEDEEVRKMFSALGAFTAAPPGASIKWQSILKPNPILTCAPVVSSGAAPTSTAASGTGAGSVASAPSTAPDAVKSLTVSTSPTPVASTATSAQAVSASSAPGVSTSTSVTLTSCCAPDSNMATISAASAAAAGGANVQLDSDNENYNDDGPDQDDSSESRTALQRQTSPGSLSKPPDDNTTDPLNPTSASPSNSSKNISATAAPTTQMADRIQSLIAENATVLSKLPEPVEPPIRPAVRVLPPAGITLVPVVPAASRTPVHVTQPVSRLPETHVSVTKPRFGQFAESKSPAKPKMKTVTLYKIANDKAVMSIPQTTSMTPSPTTAAGQPKQVLSRSQTMARIAPGGGIVPLKVVRAPATAPSSGRGGPSTEVQKKQVLSRSQTMARITPGGIVPMKVSSAPSGTSSGSKGNAAPTSTVVPSADQQQQQKQRPPHVVKYQAQMSKSEASTLAKLSNAFGADVANTVLAVKSKKVALDGWFSKVGGSGTQIPLVSGRPGTILVTPMSKTQTPQAPMRVPTGPVLIQGDRIIPIVQQPSLPIPVARSAAAASGGGSNPVASSAVASKVNTPPAAPTSSTASHEVGQDSSPPSVSGKQGANQTDKDGETSPPSSQKTDSPGRKSPRTPRKQALVVRKDPERNNSCTDSAPDTGTPSTRESETPVRKSRRKQVASKKSRTSATSEPVGYNSDTDSAPETNEPSTRESQSGESETPLRKSQRIAPSQSERTHSDVESSPETSERSTQEPQTGESESAVSKSQQTQVVATKESRRSPSDADKETNLSGSRKRKSTFILSSPARGDKSTDPVKCRKVAADTPGMTVVEVRRTRAKTKEEALPSRRTRSMKR